MLKEIYGTIKKLALAAGLVLSLLAVVEVVQAYQTLYEIHPIVGYVFAGFLAGIILWFGVGFTYAILSHPKALSPPYLPSVEKASEEEVQKYARYLSRYMLRLRKNSLLGAEERELLVNGERRLTTVVANSRSVPTLFEAIGNIEEQVVEKCLHHLDQQAKKKVSESVRDVMLGVTFSPWRSTDLLIVLIRNVGMVLEITRVYNSRPRLREQFRTLVDIGKIVATVNYLNLGAKLFETAFKSVPVIGKVSDDIAQGLGAAWFTSVAGHAAILRSRAFRSWNHAESTASVRANLGNFSADIYNIYKDTIENRVAGAAKGQATAMREAMSRAFGKVRENVQALKRHTQKEGA